MAIKNKTTGITSYTYLDEVLQNGYWQIIGSSGQDDISASDRNNKLSGGNGQDVIRGNGGDDLICGDGDGTVDTSSNGSDSLYGGAGNDIIYGGNGADLIEGDAGFDALSGGNGSDTFAYVAASDSNYIAGAAGTFLGKADIWGNSSNEQWDIITDFQSGLDKIDFARVALTGAGGALHWYAPASSDANAGSANAARAHAVWTDTAGKFVYADVTGDGKADLKIEVSGAGRRDFLGVQANNGPVANADTAATTEDLSTTFNILANDTDLNGDALSVTGASIVSGKGTVSVTPNGTLTYNPGAAYNALAEGETAVVKISYTITDGGCGGGTASAIATVTVVGTNDGPSLVVGDTTASGAVTEDRVASASGVIAFTDADLSDTHTALVTAGPDAAATFGTFTLDAVSEALGAAGGSVGWSYTIDNAKAQMLAAGETMIETYTVTLSDGHGGTVSQNVSITITGTNDVPVAEGASAGVAEDAVIEGHVSATDADSGQTQLLTYALVDPFNTPAGLTFNADGSYTFDASSYDHLAEGATEVFEIAFTASDATTTSEAAILKITVTGTNDMPEAEADVAQILENDAVEIDVLANDTDADDGHVLSLVSVSGLVGQGSVSIVDGNVFFDPGNAFDHLADGATAGVELAYTMTDEHGATSSSSITVTITGTNDVASLEGVASGDVTEGATAPVTGTITVRDVDDGEAHTISVSNGSARHGTYSIDADGNWNYVLNNADAAMQALGAGETMTDTFMVSSQDGTASHYVQIAIHGAADRASSPAEYTEGGDPNDFDELGTPGRDTIPANRSFAEYGGSGDDVINGNTSTSTGDTMFGGSGDDLIHAKQGDDTIYGGSGRDTIHGDAGNDIIIGGYGADTLTGAGGNNTFAYLSLRDTGDVITDFASGAGGDVLDFGAIDANAANGSGSNDAFGAAANSETLFAFGLSYFQSGADTILQGDTDGNTATAEIEITLAGVTATSFTSTNFVL